MAPFWGPPYEAAPAISGYAEKAPNSENPPHHVRCYKAQRVLSLTALNSRPEIYIPQIYPKVWDWLTGTRLSGQACAVEWGGAFAG